MATRWLYETESGDNICHGITIDDSNVAEPEGFAWTAADPSAPDGVDLQPAKAYTVATNTVALATPAVRSRWQLNQRKRERMEEFSRHSRRLFTRGFTVSNEKFNLEQDDLSAAMYRHANAASWTYPYQITARNGDTITVNNATQMRNFCDAALLRMREIQDGERDLRKQVFDAQTLAAVNAVTDTRT